MALSKASTAAFATSASTSICSPTLKQAREIIEKWRIDYNTNRPHSSLNGLTPTEFAARPNQGQNWNNSPYERGQIGEQVSKLHDIMD